MGYEGGVAFDWAQLMEWTCLMIGCSCMGVAYTGGVAYRDVCLLIMHGVWAWLAEEAWLIIGLRLYGCGLQRGRGSRGGRGL